MSTKFHYGQFIIKKSRPIKDVTPIPMMDMIMYSWEDKAIYGIFEVTKYKKGDWEAPIEYKVTLVPAGTSTKYFLDSDYYTSDLLDIKPEMIFDSLDLAQKFLDEFLID